MKIFTEIRQFRPSPYWGYYCSVMGLFLWVYYMYQTGWDNHTMPLIERIVLMAILILTPLALELAKNRERTGHPPQLYRMAQLFQPVAGLFALFSFLTPKSTLAAIYAVPWFIETLLLCICGLQRLAIRGFKGLKQYYIEECCLDFGLIFVLVGGSWLILSRAGIRPLDFSETIVLLTAMHFHYAGFFTLVIVGLLGRLISPTETVIRKNYFYSVFALILAIPLLAVGITACPALEMIAAFAIAGSLFAQAGLIFWIALPKGRSGGVKLMFAITALSMLTGLFYACLYSLSEFLQADFMTLSEMVKVHGVINSVGIAFCGLMAFAIMGVPASKFAKAGLPFIPVAGKGWFIGTDYFSKTRTVTLGAPSQGLMETMSTFERPGFKAADIHPDIRTFYENSTRHPLRAHVVWHGFWKGLAGLIQGIFNSMGQFSIGPATRNPQTPIRCDVHLLQRKITPHPYNNDAPIKSYVRMFEDSSTGKKQPFYTAAYTTYESEGMTYMNVAFPIWGGNISFILRPDEMPLSGEGYQGLSLTSVSSIEPKGDEGIYWVNSWFTLLIPAATRVRIWPKEVGCDMGNVILSTEDMALARKELYCWGQSVLTIDYHIQKASTVVTSAT